ncbi:MAG: hypothetical protein Q9213_002607 [Squamulea squamosa]
MGSTAASSTVRPPLTKSATAESAPPSLLSTRRRAPTPSLSFNSLNPFQASRSNVSSPGPLYLSPPISTPSFMSPPPRHEAEDYLSSYGGRKKHPGRPAAVSKTSPLGVPSHSSQRPAAQDSDEGHLAHEATNRSKVGVVTSASNVKATIHNVDNQTQQQGLLGTTFHTAADSHGPPDDIGQPLMVPSQASSQSPAVVSLRRLSVLEGDRQVSVASETNRTSQPSLGVIGSLFNKNDKTSSDSKQSDDDQLNQQPAIKRRSTASRDQDKRRGRNAETSAAILGLKIPATITLRKATGLFQLSPSQEAAAHTFADASHFDRKESTSSPTTCTLVGFDSRSLRDPGGLSSPDQDYNMYEPTNSTANKLELCLSTPGSKALMSGDSRPQSLAETAVTIANTFPSPAILASPTGKSYPAEETERRFSVVHIKSRKSLHQVIWREDDSSSSSGTSSKSVSPTRSISNNIPEGYEHNTVKHSPASSKASVQQRSSPPLSTHGIFEPNTLVTAEKLVPPNAPKARLEGQMLQWSWGVADDVLYDPVDSSDPVDRLDPVEGHTTFATGSAVPRLSIPDDEGPSATHSSPGISRRGSFVLDTTSLASRMPEREAGNRRSISITPLMLARLGDGAIDSIYSGSNANRRFSRVK